MPKGEIRDTYNNEQYKIYKIVEGVSVHDVVHDVYPSFQSDDLERKDTGYLIRHAHMCECRAHSEHTRQTEHITNSVSNAY